MLLSPADDRGNFNSPVFVLCHLQYIWAVSYVVLAR